MLNVSLLSLNYLCKIWGKVSHISGVGFRRDAPSNILGMLIICIVLEENVGEVVPRVKAQIREYMLDFRDHQLYFHVVKRNPDPLKGCYQSHFEAIEILAQRNKLGLILEEDVFFVYRFHLGEVVRNQSAAAGSGLVYLGYNAIVGCKNDETSVIGQFVCNHAVVLLDPVRTLEYVRGYKFTAEQRPVMDVVLATIPNSIGIYPMVAFQLPHVSALERRFTDYNWQLCNNAEKLYNRVSRSEKIIGIIHLAALSAELLDMLRYVPITCVYPQPLAQIILLVKNGVGVELDAETVNKIYENDVYVVSSNVWAMHSNMYSKYTIFSPIANT